jgi:hypothetical protein
MDEHSLVRGEHQPDFENANLSAVHRAALLANILKNFQ